MDPDQYKFAKFVTNFFVTRSVSKIVRDIIRNNVDEEGFGDRVQIVIGSFVIGGVVCEHMWERTEKHLDNAFAYWERFHKEVVHPTEDEPSAVIDGTAAEY